jgi:hypothetical protein
MDAPPGHRIRPRGTVKPFLRRVLFRCATPHCRHAHGHPGSCVDTAGRHLCAQLRCFDCGRFFTGPPETTVAAWRTHRCDTARRLHPT